MASQVRRQAPCSVDALRFELRLRALGAAGTRLAGLSRLASRGDVISQAWRLVRAARGGPGIDRVDPRRLQAVDVAAMLEGVRGELFAGTYRPLPWIASTRVAAPGQARAREILVPTARDRVAQGAVRLVLEPVLEAGFLDCSHGFRPGRSPRTAGVALLRAVEAGFLHVVRTDVATCFDSVRHDRLLSLLTTRLDDDLLLRWLTDWSRADVVRSGAWTRSDIGLPQGGVVSPLLANLYLHEIDAQTSARRDDLRVVRYADDIALACRSEPERELERLRESAARLGLSLNERKTSVRHASEGIDFLGLHLHQVRARGGAQAWTLRPSDAAVDRLRARLAAALTERPPATMRDVALTLAEPLAGWLAFYGAMLESQQAEAVNGVLRDLFESEARRIHQAVVLRAVRWDRLERRGLRWVPRGASALA